MKKGLYILISTVAGLFFLCSCQKEKPVASFSVVVPSVDVDEPLTFTNTSIDSYSYKWEFGDGQTSTDESPVHMFQTKGAYYVRLFAYSKNGKEVDEATCVINVQDKPTRCFVAKITFTDYPKNNAGLNWDNDSGGYYPDIYFLIANQDTSTIYLSPGVDSRIENVQSAPFSWEWVCFGVEIDINQTLYFHIYDYDSLSTDQWMATCGGFKLIDYLKYPYPNQITITCTNLSFVLDVTWGYGNQNNWL